MPSESTYDAVVVGAGPNGLAAAITIAAYGRSVLVLEAGDTVGGGIRTKELTLPGFQHDVCAAIHPLAQASPFFRSVDLTPYGLEWIQPPVPLAHPLDHEPAVLLERSLDATAGDLGQDAESYRRLIGPGVRDWHALVPELLRPLAFPRHPLMLARFGRHAMRSAYGLATARFSGTRARALFAGNAAHAIFPLEHLSSAGFGLMLAMSGHVVGWPLARGGSQAIADALSAHLVSLGGTVELGVTVSSMKDIPRAKAILFDITPRQMADIGGIAFPGNYVERLRAHRYGSGVFKVDWALDSPIPWKDRRCLLAGTLHLGGTLEEIAAAERQVWQGQLPERPFVLLSQPTLFDASRAPDGLHTAWAYCHVPNGCAADMKDKIEAQIERFAPGFKDCIIAAHTMGPSRMQAYNANYVGGDIAGGVQSFQQLFVRPLGRWQPYTTPLRGVYLCSSSMPPGAGVHGMCGHLAAQRALDEMLT